MIVTMKISFCCSNTNAQPWLEALQTALPEAKISLWQDHQKNELADYGVVWTPPQAFFDEQTKLQAVFNIGAGVDALLKRKIPPQVKIVRLEDAGMAVQMAEYVCMAVMNFYRQSSLMHQNQQQEKWQAPLIQERSEMTVGLLGLGVLGERVAKALQYFEYPVIAWSRTPKNLENVTSYVGAEQLSSFLKASKILVCLLPLTPQTEGILNKSNLEQLPKGAYLINAARGAHLIEQDLLDLLESQHLAGATLDVFRQEPLPAGHNFWQHPKIVITPHNAAQSLVGPCVAQISQQIKNLHQDLAVHGEVLPDLGY